MNNVKFIRADHLYENVTDGTHDSPKPQLNGFPLVTSKSIKGGILDITTANLISKEDYHNISKRSKVDKWDVIISMIGEYCGYTYIEKNEEINYAVKNVGLFKTRSKLEANWLVYYLQSSFGKHYINQSKSGSSQPYLSLGALRKMPVLNPAKSIKAGIVNVLSTLDAKIELNNKINAKLESMAKLIYDYWFVQFDFPDKNGKPYKSSGGKMVWNEELNREIPKKWEVRKLNEISKCLMGQSPKGESYNKDGIGIPLLNGPADYENGSLVGRTFTTEPTRLCEKDDMILCIRATIGNLTFAEKEFCLGRGVAAVRPNEKRYSELIFYILLQEIERFKKHATGSIIVGITKDDLADSSCLIPSEQLVKHFHGLIEPMFNSLRKRKEENLHLAKLRDWLLPMLMNGQVTVSDVERQVEQQLKTSVIKSSRKPSEEDYIKRKQLALQILSKSRIDQKLGKVKFEKLLHLSEYYAVKENMNQSFSKHAAGPYDPAFTHRFFDEVEKAGIVQIKKQGSRHTIEVSKDLDSEINIDLFSAEALSKIDALVKHFMGSNHEKPEIISTLYAVWNNRIIKNEMITDELLKADFLAWDEGKAQYKDLLDKNLNWMRLNGIVPDGWGKVIEGNSKNKD